MTSVCTVQYLRPIQLCIETFSFIIQSHQDEVYVACTRQVKCYWKTLRPVYTTDSLHDANILIIGTYYALIENECKMYSSHTIEG